MIFQYEASIMVMPRSTLRRLTFGIYDCALFFLSVFELLIRSFIHSLCSRLIIIRRGSGNQKNITFECLPFWFHLSETSQLKLSFLKVCNSLVFTQNKPSYIPWISRIFILLRVKNSFTWKADWGTIDSSVDYYFD